MTNNLQRRIYEHRNGLSDGFTKKYNLKYLVYYEMTFDVMAAITREKQIKRWRREKKNLLIDEFNPQWADLYDFILK